MTTDQKYMLRCIELAKNGFGNVAPNPMVGSVIVHNNIIIGEGFHQQYGKAHAEVNAINNVKDKSVLKEATIYVNLEPCAHFGKTPPCANLIIENKIPNVVIGCIDTFSEVAGKGIEKIKEAGINVTIGVLEKESLDLNKRFFTFHTRKRPYIILKWAQSLDGFIDSDRQPNEQPVKISNELSHRVSHLWRSQEAGIMVGSNTAKLDNPLLTVRVIKGNNPTRIIIDKARTLDPKLNLFNGDAKSVIFNSVKTEQLNNLNFVQIDFNQNIIPQILDYLYKNNIQSVIIEGGAKLINSFIELNVWDETRVFIGNTILNNGIKAPLFPKGKTIIEKLDTDQLITITSE
jgi:diaminohydroxyphosphoribosylaminopyrimidine deaminase/5-amino-6-(5-phosphoribosylamino)uracil reductase